MNIYILIGLGGLVGTFARFGLQGLVQRWVASPFPWGTLIVNVTGSFLIGFIVRLGTGSTAISPDMRAALTIGFCGAYTTFSTYSYETVRLLQEGDYARAIAYAGGSVVVSLAATLLGMAAAGRLL